MTLHSQSPKGLPQERDRYEPWRIFILVAARLYREGLQASLTRERSVEVVGSAPSHRSAVPLILDLEPDVLLLDAQMVGSVGIVEQILGVVPGLKVVALALSEAEPDIIAWAEAGMSGYVGLESSLEELVATIESVSQGEVRCSPSVAATLLKRVSALAHRSETKDGHPPLTAREMEIIHLIHEGHSNKEIAALLFISIATVKNHVHNILEKLQVRRRRDAATLIIARGDPAIDPR